MTFQFPPAASHVIVINAISVREGGSLVVLLELLQRFTVLRPQWRWHVTTNAQAHAALSKSPDLAMVDWHVWPDHAIGGGRICWWYETELPRLLAKSGATLLFSQTNYLPLRSLPCPALLLIQHAGHFSEEFRELTERDTGLAPKLGSRLKRLWVLKSACAANRVTVQTAALAERIVAETGIPASRLTIIPHGPGQALRQNSDSKDFPELSRPVRIGYITKYGVQKNFAVLFTAAAIMRARGRQPIIVLTLRHDHPTTKLVLKQAQQAGIACCIENHGEINRVAIDRLYHSLDLFVFPSLCESFGFPLVEALAYGLPVIASDTPSNAEVLGSAGYLFPRHDAFALAQALDILLGDPVRYRAVASASLDRGSFYDWDSSALANLALIDAMLSPLD